MELTVKLFAMLREQLGETITVSLPDQAPVKDLKQAITTVNPAVMPVLATARVAVNQTFVTDESTPLKTTDEIALIPPVSGG